MRLLPPDWTQATAGRKAATEDHMSTCLPTNGETSTRLNLKEKFPCENAQTISNPEEPSMFIYSLNEELKYSHLLPLKIVLIMNR